MTNIIFKEEQKWSSKAIDRLISGITEYNDQAAGVISNCCPLSFFLESPTGDIFGGIHGYTTWQWLVILYLWVDKEHRLLGHGSKLLERIEKEAHLRGCRYSYLDSYDFQAPNFYLRTGYSQFAELTSYPNDHKRLFLTKML